MVKKLVVAGVALLLVAVAAGAVWYFVLDDDEPEKATVGCDPEPCEASTVDTLDGTWTAVAGESSASMAITETIGGVADHTAEAELTGVSGEVVVAGDQVTSADVTVDMTTLEFIDAPAGFNVGNRTNAMRSQGLETDTFPEATFTLTAPIALPDGVDEGTAVQAEATGDLTIRGVTQPVTFGVDVVASGDTFQITPSEFVPVALADHEITVNAPGFVADIADEGTFDFLLVLEKA